MSSWIDYVRSINETKEDIFSDDYPPFMVNRALSYFPDTIMYANEMNCNERLDKRMQYDFYMEAVSKRKRISKWLKELVDPDIDLLSKHFEISPRKAAEAKAVLTQTQLEELRGYYFRGGSK